MISLDECRKILGDTGRDLSDNDLDRLRQQLYGLADIAVTCYLTRREKTVTLQAKEPSG